MIAAIEGVARARARVRFYAAAARIAAARTSAAVVVVAAARIGRFDDRSPFALPHRIVGEGGGGGDES